MQQESLPHLNLVGDFDTQVKNVMQNVRLTKQEVQDLNLLYIHLEGALQWSWPGCKVVPFGSIVTGLGIKTSDVDCFIEIPENGYIHHKDNVIIARNLLRRQPWLFHKPFAITSAKVPIVKFFHIPTHRHCDINFNSMLGVRNSRLIAFLLHLDKRAITLAVLVKYWAKVHQLTGTNKVSNYGLIMLVIYYLQQVHILPSIAKLQEDYQPLVVEHWNTAFNENFSFKTDNFTFEAENSQTLHELLGGFFKFYSTLNFDENILSPFTGQIIPRALFNKLEDIPGEFGVYKENLSSNVCAALKIDTKICVQDPFEHHRNCTSNLFPRLAASFISHLQLAAQIYEDTSKDFYIIDILARKPPPIPPTNQKKCNIPQTTKPGAPNGPIKQGKVTKLKGKGRKPKKKINGNLQELYRNINKTKKEKNGQN